MTFYADTVHFILRIGFRRLKTTIMLLFEQQAKTTDARCSNPICCQHFKTWTFNSMKAEIHDRLRKSFLPEQTSMLKLFCVE